MDRSPRVQEQRAAHHSREHHADEDGRHVPAHEEALGDPVGDGLAEVAGLALDHGARAPHQSTAVCSGITEAKASAKPTHLPSATRPSVVTRQNTAKLHIPGKNPRRNRIVVCGPCWTCVKAIRMARATGKGVRAPLRVGPRLGARPVVTSTRATAEITRTGMSQALRVAGAAPSPVWGRSARARMKLASAALKAARGVQGMRCSARTRRTKLPQLAARLAHHGARREAHA